MTDLEIALQAVRLYAESHPRPRHVTITQAADMLEVSRPTIRKLIASGKLTLNAVKRIPVGEIDAMLAMKITRTEPEAA
ncbi:MAG: helix-turn-helix domain-containing protein [Betaproteobacteria bacterium]|nr:helix-turn-helix domain-containing protein [Betaproteobacteria bacterium]